MKTWIVFLSCCAVLILISCSSPKTYHWDSVLIGGGGYVTGVEVHPQNPELIYIRTDVGGCYRYDHDKKQMVQLMDWVSIENKNYYGIAGLALDPVNENVVYAAAGKYPFAEPGDVLVSEDKGATWSPTGLNQPFGGNRHPEKLGEGLVINPHQPNQLYCAAYEAGLWRLDRRSGQWTLVADVGEDANVMAMVFDPADKNNMYAATRWNGVYRSTDGGESFSVIAGSPENISNLAITPGGDVLAASTMNDGLKRLRHPAAAQTWEDISPMNNRGEYRAIAADPHHPARLAAVPDQMNGLREAFYVSDDGGDSWTQKSCTVSQRIPWFREDFPGAAVSQILFDPNRENMVYVTDWFSVYRTLDLSADPAHWSNDIAVGHEETVCLNMAAPPANDGGVLLYSSHADITGFSHTALDEYPEPRAQHGPTRALNNVPGLAFCEQHPEYVYMLGSTGHGGDRAMFAASSDYGQTWTLSESYEADWHWGRIAVSADKPRHVVIATKDGGVRYSIDAGQSWQLSEYPGRTGLDGPVFRYNHPLAADRVLGDVFYMYDSENGLFYRSEDGGVTWQESAEGLPNPDPTYFKGLDEKYWRVLTVPGQAGHLFMALADHGLYKSTNGGDSWIKIESVREAPLVAAGAPMPDADYPAVFILGKLTDDDELWYYRSDDGGAKWTRINDEQHRLGNEPEVLEADRQVPGRIYIGMNGTGIRYGELR